MSMEQVVRRIHQENDAETLAAALFQIFPRARFGKLDGNLVVDRAEYDLMAGTTEAVSTNAQGRKVWTKVLLVSGVPTAKIRLFCEEPPSVSEKTRK